MKNTEKKNIKIGIVLSYATLIISLIGTLFISNRVLNLIGDYNYGLYSFVNSITSWLTIVSSALVASYLRYSSLEAKNNDGNIGRTNTIYLKLLLILGCLVLIIGLSIILFLYLSHMNLGAYNWKDSELMYLLFCFSIINIAITMPFTLFDLFINYKKQFIFQKIVKIIIIILNFIGHFLIAYFTKSIILISIYSIFITCISFLANYLFSRKIGISFTKVRLKENSALIQSIAFFSSVLLFNSIVDQVNSNVDKTLLGIFSIPEYVTIYQMGQFFPSYLGEMSVAISGVFAPTINQMIVEGDKEKINGLFLNISRIQAIVVCFIVFGFLSCGEDFILWWLGPSRGAVYYVASILMLLNIMPLSVKTSIDIQRAMNKHKFRSIVFFAVAVMNIGLSVLFLHIFSKENAIYACLLGTVVSMILTQWIAMNIYNIKAIKLPMKKFLLRFLICIIYGFIGVGIVLLMKNCFIITLDNVFMRFLIEGIIFAFSYFILIIIFEKRFLFDFIKNK